MSIVVKHKRRKGKHPRWNHKSYHNSRRVKRKGKILHKSGWKLNYPEIFKLISEFPYIIRKDVN